MAPSERGTQSQSLLTTPTMQGVGQMQNLIRFRRASGERFDRPNDGIASVQGTVLRTERNTVQVRLDATDGPRVAHLPPGLFDRSPRDGDVFTLSVRFTDNGPAPSAKVHPAP